MSAKSALDTLRKNANTDGKKSKKSKIPSFEASDTTMGKNIREWIDANRAKKAAESRVAEIKGRLVRPINDIRIRKCRDSREVLSTIKIFVDAEKQTGLKRAEIKLTAKNKFCKMRESECKDIIQTEFAGDDFEKYFSVEERFYIDPKMFSVEEIEKIVKALGPKGAERLGNTREATISPTDSFWSDATLNSDIYNKWQRLQEQGVCKPEEPSIQEA